MRIIYLFLFLTVFLVNNSQAQIGIKAGGNFSSINNKGSERIFIDDGPGFHVGIIGEFSLNEKYAIETGPLFMFKSLPYDAGGFIDQPQAAYTTFAMLEIPILLKRFVNVAEIPLDFSVGPTFNYADDYTGFYAGFQLGSGVQIDDFHVSIFYQANLSPLKIILSDVGQQSLYGKNFGLSVKYNIFMKGNREN